MTLPSDSISTLPPGSPNSMNYEAEKYIADWTLSCRDGAGGILTSLLERIEREGAMRAYEHCRRLAWEGDQLDMSAKDVEGSIVSIIRSELKGEK